MLENGASSVMHSIISMANEYVSECIVACELLNLRSSGAAYLTAIEFAVVFGTVPSLTSPIILKT